jgi:propanol-preferring alcohol dehydrogenase
VKAAVLTELPASGLELRADLPDPEPEPGEAIVEVVACGICGTDLEILRGRSYAPRLPFVLGHEPVGRVVAVGPGVESDWIGRRVTTTIFVGQEEHCATCRAHPRWKTPCRVGDERLCYDGAEVIGVLGRPGAFAERLALPARLLVPVPDGLDPFAAACLVDAGATAANAVRQVDWEDPRRVAVLGAGPLGFLAAQLLGGEPLVVDPLAPRREAAAAIGLATAATLEEGDEPLGAIVDCAGAPGLLDRGLELLGPRGTYVVAGYGPVEPHMAPLARKELSIRGVRSGRREDLERVLAAVAAGDVRAPEATVWPLAEIDAAFAALRAGTVSGKAVIELSTTRRNR